MQICNIQTHLLIKLLNYVNEDGRHDSSQIPQCTAVINIQPQIFILSVWYQLGLKYKYVLCFIHDAKEKNYITHNPLVEQYTNTIHKHTSVIYYNTISLVVEHDHFSSRTSCKCSVTFQTPRLVRLCPLHRRSWISSFPNSWIWTSYRVDHCVLRWTFEQLKLQEVDVHFLS